MMGETDPKHNLWQSIVAAIHRMHKFRQIMDRGLFFEKMVVNQLIDYPADVKQRVSARRDPFWCLAVIVGDQEI